jgi:hypothetical protein
MKVLKPEKTMYTLYSGIVVKCTVKSYINDGTGKGRYLVSLPKGKIGIIQRDRLFPTIDACIDDFQASLMREAAQLEMQRPKPQKEPK